MLALTMGYLECSSLRSTVLVTVLCARGTGFRRDHLLQLGLNHGHMGGRLIEETDQLTFSLVRSASLTSPKLRCFLRESFDDFRGNIIEAFVGQVSAEFPIAFQQSIVVVQQSTLGKR